jgi:hypothetical protein
MLGITFGGSEFEKIVSREIELTNKKRGALAQLETAREAAGVAILENDGNSEVDTVSRLNAEIEATTRAIGLLRARRPAAIMNQRGADIETVRAEAATKRRELNALQAKTGKLLSELSKLESVEYGQWLLSYQAEGLVAFDSVVKTTPRSQQLMTEIGALESKAEVMESAPLSTYGYVDLGEATSDEHVVEAVLRHHSVGPSAESVQGWISACADTNRVPGKAFGNMPRRVRLEWNDGKIDTGASLIFVRDLARKRSGVQDSTGRIVPGESGYLLDTASAEFRAAA